MLHHHFSRFLQMPVDERRKEANIVHAFNRIIAHWDVFVNYTGFITAAIFEHDWLSLFDHRPGGGHSLIYRVGLPSGLPSFIRLLLEWEIVLAPETSAAAASTSLPWQVLVIVHYTLQAFTTWRVLRLIYSFRRIIVQKKHRRRHYLRFAKADIVGPATVEMSLFHECLA